MSRKILIIDDDRDVYDTLAIRLESFGYQMAWAKNGTEGYAQAKAQKPDLIFLDFNMYLKYENRTRFTLAHEVGHLILHGEIFKKLNINSVEKLNDFSSIRRRDASQVSKRKHR